MFFNLLTLLACTQSVDTLFHTLMVLWENEYFLTSNLLCFFTSVKLCLLVIVNCLNFGTKYYNQYFITIYYLNHFYFIRSAERII